MKVTINEVLFWERDNVAINGDASHEGYEHVMPLVYAEEKEIKEKGWPNLPFTYETETEDKDEAEAEAIDEYAAHHTDYTYFRPTDCDCGFDEDDGHDLKFLLTQIVDASSFTTDDNGVMCRSMKDIHEWAVAALDKIESEA